MRTLSAAMISSLTRKTLQYILWWSTARAVISVRSYKRADSQMKRVLLSRRISFGAFLPKLCLHYTNVTAERINRSYCTEISSPQTSSWTRNKTLNSATSDSLKHFKVMLRDGLSMLKHILVRLTICHQNNATARTIMKRVIFGHSVSFFMKWHSSARLLWRLISCL